MNKTRLGISVGLMAALVWLLGLYAGWVALVLVVGYVMVAEESMWLKKQALRAVAIFLMFAILGTALNVIPNLLGLVSDFAQFARVYLNFTRINNLFYLLGTIVSMAKTYLILVLSILMLFGKNFKIPLVDSFIDKLLN